MNVRGPCSISRVSQLEQHPLPGTVPIERPFSEISTVGLDLESEDAFYPRVCPDMKCTVFPVKALATARLRPFSSRKGDLGQCSNFG